MELSEDLDELSSEVFWAFVCGVIVPERCRFGARFREGRRARAAGAFQISRAPKLPAFRPECVVAHGSVDVGFLMMFLCES